MTGVEILNQTEIYKDNMTAFLIGALISAVIGITFMIILNFCFDNAWSGPIGFALAFVGCLIATFATTNTIPTGKYEYEVLIDDTVNFKEFYEKYEVIDEKGSIFVIREKE